MQITAILTPDETAKTAAGTSQTQTSEDFADYMDQSTSDSSLTSIFQKASETYGVSTSLLTAMAKQESNFQADATSKAGAMGIMQLMPATAASLGCTDAYDPEQNIMAGAKYISQLLQKYDGNVSLALAAYNAGSNNVDKYGGIPPFEETQNYVAKITSYMNEGVTLPDGSATEGTSDSSNLTSSLLKNLDEDTFKEILNKIFSYDDYLNFISQLVSSLSNAASQTSDEDKETATAAASTSVTGKNASLSVTVKGSNPVSDTAVTSADTTDSTSDHTASNLDNTTADTDNTDSNLYYAYQSINYNNSVLQLLSQKPNTDS